MTVVVEALEPTVEDAIVRAIHALVKDAISYFSFREVFRRTPSRAGGIAENPCSP